MGGVSDDDDDDLSSEGPRRRAGLTRTQRLYVRLGHALALMRAARTTEALTDEARAFAHDALSEALDAAMDGILSPSETDHTRELVMRVADQLADLDARASRRPGR